MICWGKFFPVFVLESNLVHVLAKGLLDEHGGHFTGGRWSNRTVDSRNIDRTALSVLMLLMIYSLHKALANDPEEGVY